MKTLFTKIQPQYYLSDSAGKKKSIVFDMQKWQEFTEELEDLILGLVAKSYLEMDPDVEVVSHEKVAKRVQKRIIESKKKKKS